MTDFAIAPAPRPTLPVRGTAKRFPVRRIWCIGRNYAAHAREMGHDPTREAPFFFHKNPENAQAGEVFRYPPGTREVHHEVELVVALASGGEDIAPGDAPGCVFGYAVGLDMTRRDLQAQAKAAGRPWSAAKAAEGSAPMGEIVPAAEISHPEAGRIALSVNVAVRQESDLSRMIWSVPEMIAILSRFFTLGPGDLIMTGTPAGVGPVVRGDLMEA
jgi:fumarylpyruvate hydrolase